MLEIHGEACINSQDSPSETIGGFAAHASVPQAGLLRQSDDLTPTDMSKTAAGNTYIDCTYRDDEQRSAVGIVEIVGTQEEKSFGSLEELLMILNATKVGAVITWKK